jgi:P-type conjugative transfer protein TrbJ
VPDLSRRALLLGGGAAALMAHPALADFFSCTGPCATMWEQLVQIFNQVKSYALQLQQYFAEFQTYQNTAFAIISLPSQIWATVQGDIAMVRGIANAASILTGNAGSIISRLQTAGAYASTAAMTPTMITNQFDMWSATIGRSANKLGELLDMSNEQEKGYGLTQTQSRMHSEGALGQVQALQAVNEQVDLVNTQLNQVHAAISNFAQFYATDAVVRTERQAQQDAAENQFMQQNTLNWSNPWHF